MKTSKFIGVSKHRKKWRARLTVNGCTMTLGTFDTPQDAAMAYDNVALGMKGRKLNFNGLKAEGTRLNLDEPIWLSSDGRRVPVSLLHNNHLLNIERRLRYEGATVPDAGSQVKWYTIINAEIVRRHLSKLPPHSNQTYATAEVQVWKSDNQGKKHKNGVALIDLPDLPITKDLVWFDNLQDSGPPVAINRHTGKVVWLASLIVGTGHNGLVIHQNENFRDCRRRNLVVPVKAADLKVMPDGLRIYNPVHKDGYYDPSTPSSPLQNQKVVHMDDDWTIQKD